MGRYFSLALLFLFTSITAIAQTSIYGKISDVQDGGEGLIGANITLFKNGVIIAGQSTDFDGNYKIDIDSGTYDIEVSYIGYAIKKITGVLVKAGQANKFDIEMGAEGSEITLNDIVVTAYKIPLLKRDYTSSRQRVTSEHIRNLPTRDVGSLAAKTAGLKQAKEGDDVTIVGSRDNTTEYYKAEMPSEPNTESYQAIVENDYLSTLSSPLSTFSVDVDNASYSNMRRFLREDEIPPVDAVRIEELINYFDYDYPQPNGKHPFSVTTEVAPCPWNEQHQLVHIGLQARSIAKDKLPAANLVFLLDVSGSMDYDEKLPLLKSAFHLLVEELRPDDRVAIVVYAGASGLVLPSTPGTQKEQILAALDKLEAGGSTAGEAGIKLAYEVAHKNFIKGGNNRVILATDGDFNVGINRGEDLLKLIEKKRKSGIFLSVLGFGMGNYKDAEMEILADNGNGNYAYIDQLNEAQKVLVNEFSSTLYTIAKDVKIQIEFNPSHVKEYRLIGYENRLLEDKDFNDDKIDAGEIGAGHTVTALYEVVPAGSEESLSSNIDQLKYQKQQSNGSPELMTVKLRYKPLRKLRSRKISIPVLPQEGLAPSDNFRFSAAVAGFGLLLRDSKYKGKASYESISQLASGALGADPYGYRQEFLELIELAKTYDDRLIAER